jgi:hypothetical protein
MPNIDRFTVGEIRAAYLAIKSDTSIDKEDAWNFVFKELKKLSDKQWLTKTTSKQGRVTRFKKTKLFDPNLLKETSSKNDERLNQNQASDLRGRLKSLLKKCNVELLNGLGALETYLDLRERYPYEADGFKNKYAAVQERNHILEGKINALEDILKTINET